MLIEKLIWLLDTLGALLDCSTVVRIHPAWRGYSYFIVDDEIIIVDSRTLQIVAVLVV